MIENSDGAGYFSEIILNPIVTITDETKASEVNYLHVKAGKFCFIANFSVKHKPTINNKQR